MLDFYSQCSYPEYSDNGFHNGKCRAGCPIYNRNRITCLEEGLLIEAGASIYIKTETPGNPLVK